MFKSRRSKYGTKAAIKMAAFHRMEGLYNPGRNEFGRSRMELSLFKKYTLLLFFILSGNSLFAFSSLPEKCPDEFVGKVISISPISSSQTSLPKLRVQIDKGIDEDFFFDLVQGSSVQFIEGRNYQIGMRGAFLCEAIELAF